jgi:hypothetical protein
MKFSFYSDVDGYDEVPVSPKRSVFRQLRDVVETFLREGYEVIGGIEYMNRRYEGQYEFIGRGERVLMEVH